MTKKNVLFSGKKASQWGVGAPHTDDTVEYVDFNINMTLFGVVDSVYKNLTKKPEKNS